MNISEQELDERHRLSFSTRRSIRYHDRRAGFIELLHRWSTLMLILLAGTTVMDLAGSSPPLWIKVIAVAAVILSAVDVVVGFSKRADLHRDLKRQFIRLERELNEGLELRLARSKRLEIEALEPPIYRALDLMCHNAECMAMGRRPSTDPDDFEFVGWFRRVTANVFHWSDAPKVVRRSSQTS